MKVPIQISTPATIFTKIYLDAMVMTKSKKGNTYLVCARDNLSRASEGRALVQAKSEALADFFWKQIYC